MGSLNREGTDRRRETPESISDAHTLRAEGRRRVWPALVIKPCDVHSSVVRLAATARYCTCAGIFNPPVRDGCYSLLWAALRFTPRAAIEKLSEDQHSSKNHLKSDFFRPNCRFTSFAILGAQLGFHSECKNQFCCRNNTLSSPERGSARPLRGGSNKSF